MKSIILLFLIFLIAPLKAADEIHFTIIGQTSVTFNWRGASDEKTIQFGTTSGVYSRSVTAVAPAITPFSSAGPFWEARLTGLTENTRYYYKIANLPEKFFKTPPPRGSANFIVCSESDIQNSGGSGDVRCDTVQNQIAREGAALVLLPGDLTGANNHGQPMVDKRFNDFMKWSLTAAAMPAWGNHDWDLPWDGSLAVGEHGDDLRNYKGRFDLPNAQTSPTSPAVSCCGEDWYWFDYGNVRFITYPEPWTSGVWTDWAHKADSLMALVDADNAIRFIVTYGHRPAYCSGHHPGSATLAGIMDGLGDKHKKYVLNIAGHSHLFERSYPQHGVRHVTGSSPYALEQDGSCLYATCQKPAWSEKRFMHLGYVKLIVLDNLMHVQFIAGPAGGGTNDVTRAQGAIIDSFSIPASGSTAVHLAQPLARARWSARVLPGNILSLGIPVEKDDDCRIRITDVLGRTLFCSLLQVRAGQPNDVKLNLSKTISAGIYYLRVTGTNSDFASRLFFGAFK